jgi:phage/plasmid-associated DNA primase
MDGCLEWQRTGLAPPKSVLDATDDYFGEQDNLQQWLDECTTDAGKLAITRLKELFTSWKAWCEAANIAPGSDKTLSEALRDKGFIKQLNRAGQSCFRNIVIRLDASAEG